MSSEDAHQVHNSPLAYPPHPSMMWGFQQHLFAAHVAQMTQMVVQSMLASSHAQQPPLPPTSVLLPPAMPPTPTQPEEQVSEIVSQQPSLPHDTISKSSHRKLSALVPPTDQVTPAVPFESIEQLAPGMGALLARRGFSDSIHVGNENADCERRGHTSGVPPGLGHSIVKAKAYDSPVAKYDPDALAKWAMRCHESSLSTQVERSPLTLRQGDKLAIDFDEQSTGATPPCAFRDTSFTMLSVRRQISMLFDEEPGPGSPLSCLSPAGKSIALVAAN